MKRGTGGEYAISTDIHFDKTDGGRGEKNRLQPEGFFSFLVQQWLKRPNMPSHPCLAVKTKIQTKGSAQCARSLF